MAVCQDQPSRKVDGYRFGHGRRRGKTRTRSTQLDCREHGIGHRVGAVILFDAGARRRCTTVICKPARAESSESSTFRRQSNFGGGARAIRSSRSESQERQRRVRNEALDRLQRDDALWSWNVSRSSTVDHLELDDLCKRTKRARSSSRTRFCAGKSLPRHARHKPAASMRRRVSSCTTSLSPAAARKPLAISAFHRIHCSRQPRI